MNDADKESLREHFREEAEEHLQALDKALLSLESRAGDSVFFSRTMAEMLRRLHSLKGAAKLAGAAETAGIAHALETVCGEIHSLRLVLDAKTVDTLLEAVDGMKTEVSGALGEPAAQNLIARLLALASSSKGIDDTLARLLPSLDPEIREILTEFQKAELVFAREAGKACWEAEFESEEAEFSARIDHVLKQLKTSGEVLSMAGVSSTLEGGLRFKILLATRLDEPALARLCSELSVVLKNPEQPLPAAVKPVGAASPQEEEYARELAKLQEQYIGEAGDTLEELSTMILALDEGKEDAQLLQRLFRITHNLKGSGAAYGLPSVSRISHQMESVLDALRNRKLKITRQLTDTLLGGADALKEIFAAARTGDLTVEPSPAVGRDLEAVARGEAPGRATEAPSAAPAVRLGAVESIRVNLHKLDHLVNLASEMTISIGTREAAVKEIDARAGQAKEVVWLWKKLRDDLQLGGHASMLRADGLMDHFEQIGSRLGLLEGDLEGLWNRFSTTTLHAGSAVEALQHDVMRIRMVPAAMLFDAAARLVRDMTRDKAKEVRLEISGSETEVDKRVLELMADPITHILRNAVDHGIEPAAQRRKLGKPPSGTIALSAEHRGDHIVITVKDDGCGLDPKELAAKAVEKGLISASDAEKLLPDQARAFIFHPGFSTKEKVTEISGRGVGLDVVKTNVESLKGRIELASSPGSGTTFTIHLPLSLSIIQVILIECSGQRFCLQTNSITEIVRVAEEDVQSEDGKACVQHRGKTIPVVRLAELLGLKTQEPGKLFVVVVFSGIEGNIGFAVDAALEYQTVVLKEMGKLLRKVPHVAGGTILADGRVILILDPPSLISAAIRGAGAWAPARVEKKTAAPPRKRLLVVDDSLTTRELLRGLLETAGYAVLTARDGREAWAALEKKPVDLVVCDVSMPEMDGYELTARIRASRRFAALPVVLVTSLATEEEKLKGLNAGADAYIVKGAFDQAGLLQRIRELAGHE